MTRVAAQLSVWLLTATLGSGLQQSDAISELPLLAEINAGQSISIWNAGKSGNLAYVPHLRKLLSSRKAKKMDVVTETKLALARLGEPDMLQELVCEARSPYPDIQQDALTKKLRYVRGWFSLRLFLQALDADEEWEKNLKNDDPGNADIARLPPSQWALVELPEIVPNPPLGPVTIVDTGGKVAVSNAIKTWREWIVANQSSLQKLEPTGEGVDFSAGACKNGKPAKKRFAKK
jgi:hypothetical protein